MYDITGWTLQLQEFSLSIFTITITIITILNFNAKELGSSLQKKNYPTANPKEVKCNKLLTVSLLVACPLQC